MLSLAVTGTAEATSDWLTALTRWVDVADGYVWGLPLILTVLATGVLLTCVIRFSHLVHIGRAFRYMLAAEEDGKGEVSAFGALCTALAATIGIGNIVGVATAVGTGGPGALFWMVVAAFFGMGTKYAEGLLAVKYREVAPDGRVLGGPFYYIEKGLGRRWKPLAIAFALFGALASIMGTGTLTQIHGITSAVQRFFDPQFNPADLATGVRLFGATYSVSAVVAGVLVTTAVALVLIGGLKRIAAVSTFVVPFMAVVYVVICLLVILGNLGQFLPAVKLIVRSAFDPAAMTGGAVGTVFVAMQKGISRGIFSNEAGLGSAPIAAAAAKTNEPARQGLVCMMGTFVTLVICVMTGLAIVITGAWEPSLGLKGVDITIEAFDRGLSFLPSSRAIASLFLMVSLVFFAFTTILGWNYYAERCLEYVVGMKRQGIIRVYRFLYILVVFAGPYFTVSVVWGVADIFNGLMAFPNLIALVLLSPVVWRVTKDFFDRHPRAAREGPPA